MSKDAAQDIMAQMRQQQQKKKEQAKPTPAPSTAGADEVYTKLIVNVRKRRRIWLMFPLLFLVMLWLVQRDLLTDKHWFLVAIPIIVVGCLTLLLPASEDWQYRPWQSRARRIEQHLTR